MPALRGISTEELCSETRHCNRRRSCYYLQRRRSCGSSCLSKAGVGSIFEIGGGAAVGRVLISWIGHSDLRAAAGRGEADDVGPVLRLLRDQRIDRFDVVHLLNDILPSEFGVSFTQYVDWLRGQLSDAAPEFRSHSFQPLKNNYPGVFAALDRPLGEIQTEHGDDADYSILLGPGGTAYNVGLFLRSQPLRPKLWATSREEEVEEIPWAPEIRVDADAARRPLPPKAWRPRFRDHAPAAAFQGIGGSSKALRFALWQAERAAPTPLSVLLTGETGTGKELFARAIHVHSGRPGNFVPVNCAAIPETLLETELFGHVKGVFTDAKADKKGVFELAQGGTLFLDEIGDMPAGLQAKLLRVLQEKKIRPVGGEAERPVDVRVLAATNQNLDRKIKAGTFREDLYHRFPLVIPIPPLRERGEDVLELARTLLKRACEKSGRPPLELDESALKLLGRPRRWAGNVRELEKIVDVAAAFAASDARTITADDVSLPLESQWVGRHFGAWETLGNDEFVAELVAALDELLRRNAARRWPWLNDGEGLDQFLPLLALGRAVELSDGQPRIEIVEPIDEAGATRNAACVNVRRGTPTKTARFLGRERIDLSKDTAQSALLRYVEHIRPKLPVFSAQAEE